MITKVEYGTWRTCIAIVRRSKMKCKDPNKRIFDRYDIEDISGKNPEFEKFKLTLYKGE